MEMTRFTRDNETRATAEKTQLLVTESFPKKVTQTTGYELRNWSNPFDGFPRKGSFFVLPQKEIEAAATTIEMLLALNLTM